MYTSDPQETQTLDSFVMETRGDLEAFYRHWLEQNDLYPSRYPLSLSPGEWFEQFLAWLTLGG